MKLETGAMSMLGKTVLCLVSLTHQNYLLFNLLILGLYVCVCVCGNMCHNSDGSYCKVVIMDMFVRL